MNKLESLRDKLNKMVAKQPISSPEVLKLSREIDAIIVRAQKRACENKILKLC